MEDRILLSHGSGGLKGQQLIQEVFYKHFGNQILNTATDSAILPIEQSKIAYTTDSYVVDPIFFPGGNIGKLAVCGTVNDLAVSGAIPQYLSAGFIIEEGFLLSDLDHIVASMAEEAKAAGVSIVTGDTKVVNKGQCDKIFINTAGIGFFDSNLDLGCGNNIQSGDKIIINGDIGDHGIAIMVNRHNIPIRTAIESDCTCLNKLMQKVTGCNPAIHFARDVTRGGLATILCEIAEKAGLGIEIWEDKLPIKPAVRGACEMLGFDPLYIANEGKVCILADEVNHDAVVKIMQGDPAGTNSAKIGEIVDDHPGKVVLRTSIGSSRIITMLEGEQLPRIC